MITVRASNDPATICLCFHFRGRQIAVFEVEADWAADQVVTELRPEPFTVLHRLNQYLAPCRGADMVQYAIVSKIYEGHRDEVLRDHYERELDRSARCRIRLQAALDEVEERQIEIRSHLQDLPIKR